MINIIVKNLKKSFFKIPVFDDVSFEVKSGETIALIGENGCGKTTVFKILCQEETKDSGEVSIRKTAKIGFLKQIPSHYPQWTVKQVMMQAFSDVEKVAEHLRKLEKLIIEDKSQHHLDTYGHLQHQFEQLGGYDIDEAFSKVCIGLNFTSEFLNRPFALLSGGEKTRVELGKLLLEKPDILLLDEPTNHLDIETSKWLETYIKQFSGSILIISHDRYFLDQVVDKIYEIKEGKTEVYHGNYSYYLIEREKRYQEQILKYQQQEKKIEQMQESIKRFEAWGSQGDNEKMFIKARNMEKRIDKMEKIDRPVLNSQSIKLNLTTEDRSGNQVLVINDLTIGFDDAPPLLCHANLTIRYKDKIALIGRNGSGKTSLFNSILAPNASSIKIGSRVKIGYIEQEPAFTDQNLSLLAYMKDELNVDEGTLRHYLAKFKFYNEDVHKKINMLSGGEKIRIKLALLMKQEANFLILDEPTNHIDIKTKEILEENLKDYSGTVFFISHDRYFINQVANKVVVIDQQTLTMFDGNYEAYALKAPRICNVTKTEKKIHRSSDLPIQTDKKLNKWQIEQLEREISALESEITQTKLDIEKHSHQYDRLELDLKKLKVLEDDLNEKLEKWLM